MFSPYALVEKNALENPTGIAVIYGKTKLTFEQVHHLASRIGTAMRLEGVRPGQTILIFGGNPIRDYIFSLAGLHQAVAITLQTGPIYNEQIAADFAFSRVPIPSYEDAKTIIIDDRWMNRAESLDALPSQVFPDEKSTVRLLQTSGTTGIPKVLEYDFEAISQMTLLGMPQDLIARFRIDRRLTALPLATIAGCTHAYFSVQAGLTFYLSTLSPKGDADMVEAHSLNALFASPSMVSSLIQEPDSVSKLASLEMIFCTGGSLSSMVIQKIRLVTQARLINRFGSTEVGSIAWREIQNNDEATLIGVPYHEVDIQIVDSIGNRLPAGEVGSIGVKTPSMRTFYRNNPAATRENFVDGYFFSGDEGFLTVDGSLHLLGRSDERINAGGRKVDPNQVDAAILEIDGISDAAVFGFDRKDGIRGLAAAVVKKSDADERAVIKQISSKLGSKRPDRFVFVDAIPRNHMGKVKRLELESLYLNIEKPQGGWL